MNENATPSGSDQPVQRIRTFADDMRALPEEGSVPERSPIPPPLQSPPSPPRPASLDRLKTYGGDFSQRMKETHASTATILAAEQDETPLIMPQASEEPSRANALYIVGGAILLVVGAVGAYFAYTRYLTALAPVVLAPRVAAPIFVDDREQISGTGAELLHAVEKSVARPLAANTVRLLYVASTTTTGSVFSALQTSAPFTLLRNIHAQGSMAGVVNIGGSQSPFFILSVSSYSNTFAGMLSWETAMPRNLAALFPAHTPPPVPTASTSSTPSSAPQTVATTASISVSVKQAPAKQLGFHDEAISNHDARVYRDEAGRSVLVYGYWDQTTLVIARDPAAFTEILQRLATSRAQ